MAVTDDKLSLFQNENSKFNGMNYRTLSLPFLQQFFLSCLLKANVSNGSIDLTSF